MNLPEIVKNKLLYFGARATDSYLVAVSGGADSAALLLAMHASLGDEGRLTVAHLDHGMRPGSDEDARRVVDLCGSLGIKPHTGKLDRDEMDVYRRRYGSLEAGMRDLRYRFFHETAEKSDSKWIVTGHTADDQSETVLFRALRGMDWRSLRGIPEKRGNILRPLIDVPRWATWSYCRVMGVSPITDPTNFDETYTRSKIRNQTLPGLASTFNPDVSKLLRHTGRSAGRLLLAERKLLDAVVPGSGGTQTATIHRDFVQALPEILQKGVIISFLFGVLNEYPSVSLTEEVLGFILAGRNGRLSLPGESVLTISYGLARFGEENTDTSGDLSGASVELKIPGRVVLPSARMIITAHESVLEMPGEYPCGKTALISRKHITGSLWVRKRLPGDYFMPIGMVKEKKLKDFLVDRKVPRAIRDRIPILLDDQGDIVWVGGIEISRKAALDGLKGEKAVLIRIEDMTTGEHSSDSDGCN